jgi:hypothetical protein
VLKITGATVNFVEGSELRRTFLSSLASVLAILESQIVILSVKSGSIIVELAFVRDSNSIVSPSEAILRLEKAHLDGKLEKFGALDLKIGGQSVNLPSSSSASSPLVYGSSTAAAVIFVVILLLAIKHKRHRQKVCEHETAPPPPTLPITPPSSIVTTLELTPAPDPPPLLSAPPLSYSTSPAIKAIK